MALGFERRCIGDIIVREDGFDVLTNSEIDDFLLMSDVSIRRVPMKAKKIALENWQAPERTLKMFSVLVAQTRLDAVIAKVFNLSRSQAVEFIRAGLVQIDHQVVTNAVRRRADHHRARQGQICRRCRRRNEQERQDQALHRQICLGALDKKWRFD